MIFEYPFVSQRAAELSCVSGVWDRVVSCEPVDCGLPDNSHVYFASFTCPWGTTFGKQCTFSCNSPSTLQGNTLSVLMFSFLLCLSIFIYPLHIFYESTTYFMHPWSLLSFSLGFRGVYICLAATSGPLQEAPCFSAVQTGNGAALRERGNSSRIRSWFKLTRESHEKESYPHLLFRPGWQNG